MRREAAGKFPFSDRMYFTREALEQASPQEVSEYRSQRYRPFRLLADLGCSVGGDTLSLAAISPTLGIDRDPLRLAMTRANLAALGLDRRVQLVQADLIPSLPLGSIPDLAWFFDPARRAGGVRMFSPGTTNRSLTCCLAGCGASRRVGSRSPPESGWTSCRPSTPKWSLSRCGGN